MTDKIRRFLVGIYGTDQQRHPYRVAAYAQNHDETIVALLHDVVEDGYATFDDLTSMGVTPQQQAAISLLTRRGEPYHEYIETIAAHAAEDCAQGNLALNVKLYDLFDHLHAARVANLSSERINRYVNAVGVLARVRAKDA